MIEELLCRVGSFFRPYRARILLHSLLVVVAAALASPAKLLVVFVLVAGLVVAIAARLAVSSCVFVDDVLKLLALWGRLGDGGAAGLGLLTLFQEVEDPWIGLRSTLRPQDRAAPSTLSR